MKQETKEFIKYNLKGLMGLERTSESIEQLENYLNYTADRFRDNYSSILDEFAEANQIKQYQMIKSFMAIEDFLGNLTTALKFRDKITALPSEQNKTPVWTMQHYLKDAFEVFPANLNLSRESKIEFLRNNQKTYPKDRPEYHFLLLYHYRNLMDHNNGEATTNTLNASDVNDITVSMLYVMLYLVHEYNDKLEVLYQNKVYKQFDFEGYQQSIISRYNKQGFVYLDVKWDENEGEGGITIDNMIENNGKGMIAAFIGEAGSGKTTALRRLEYKYASKRRKNFEGLPVFIELKRIGAGKDRLVNAIGEALGTDSDYTRQILSEKGLVLLLDGMNEIPDSHVVADVRREIEEIYSGNKSLHIYLTDRTNRSGIFDITTATVTIYHLHALTWNNKIEYLRNNSNSEEVKALIENEIEKGELSDINSLTTPLMLNIFLNYINGYGKLPEDVFESYIDKLFERELKEQKDADDPKYIEQLKAALAVLASSFGCDPFKRPKAALLIGTLRDKLAYTELDSSSTIDLAIKMGLLTDTSDGICFSNSEFADYFLVFAVDEGLDEILDDII